AAINATATAPRTGRKLPSSASSPNAITPSSARRGSRRSAASSASAMGRSKAGPSLRTSAGARLTTMRLGGSGRPSCFNAARTRSRDSCTAAPGRPTSVKEGRPLVTKASTRTSMASTPTSVAEVARAYIDATVAGCAEVASEDWVSAGQAYAPTRSSRSWIVARTLVGDERGASLVSVRVVPGRGSVPRGPRRCIVKRTQRSITLVTALAIALVLLVGCGLVPPIDVEDPFGLDGQEVDVVFGPVVTGLAPLSVDGTASGAFTFQDADLGDLP